MENSDWLSIWQESDTPSFHLDEVNPLLIKYWREANQVVKKRCLIPLCGRSEDILWLATRHEAVTGIELSEIAIKAFFERHQLSPKETQLTEQITTYHANNITLYQADIFDPALSKFIQADFLYDRAALIAIPPTQQAGYIAACQNLLEPSSNILLLTMSFEAKHDNRPPFAMTPESIINLYQTDYYIKQLHQAAHKLCNHDSLFERGISELTHQVHRLTLNANQASFI